MLILEIIYSFFIYLKDKKVKNKFKTLTKIIIKHTFNTNQFDQKYTLNCVTMSIFITQLIRSFNI